MELINTLVGLINHSRLHQIDNFRRNPVKVQEETLLRLVNTAKDTEFGKSKNFKRIKNYSDFSKNVPIHTYEEYKPYVEKIMNGEKNICWPNETKWFAKSSGTTADKSKFIPITKESLEECHMQSGKDIYLLYIDKKPNTKVFVGKSLVIGGSTNINMNFENSYSGDLSAILIKNLPFWTYFHRLPSEEIALIDKWEVKLEQIINTTLHKNVTNIVGVPSWFLVLFKRILEETGKSNIHEVWPNLELFIHGGISFTPYKSIYQKMLPEGEMNYFETYNASEGFFGMQDEFDVKGKSDMLLMLDYGIFFEFIPMSNFDETDPELSSKAIPIEQVKTDVNYAVVISTNGGLWRYLIGDTISFTSTNPYRFKITGRTKHFINAFGEEVIIENAQKALYQACKQTEAEIRDYTAAPIYMNQNNKGSHQWLFEFITPPKDMNVFMKVLDETLKQVNSDYEAKRYQDLTLEFPKHLILKNGTFYNWLKEKGKLGGQNKVPRLSNNRQYVEELIKINKS